MSARCSVEDCSRIDHGLGATADGIDGHPVRCCALAVEHYTPPRLAQFLLENATDAQDYARARREVRRLGVDPDRVPHDPPARS